MNISSSQLGKFHAKSTNFPVYLFMLGMRRQVMKEVIGGNSTCGGGWRCA